MTPGKPPPSGRRSSEDIASALTSGPRPPARTSSVVLQLLAGVAVIAAGVTALVLVSSSQRAAVEKYVGLVRDKKTSEAYSMLASARREEIGPDDYPERLNTRLLAGSTALRIVQSSSTSAGRGCVITSVEDARGARTVYFYVLEEEGGKTIHSVLTGEELTGDAASPEPWHCD